MSITHQDEFDHVGQAETMLCAVCEKFRNPKDCEEDEFGDNVCKSCRDNRDEAAYDRQQERLMEGPDTSVQDRLDQQLRDAGRGHLVR